MFEIIPAIDIKSGKVVRLLQGKEDRITFEADDPVQIAKTWIKKGARILHVVDLDGAFSGTLKNKQLLTEILNLNVDIQIGGGIRSISTAKELLNLGVKRVILGTLALYNINEVRSLIEKFKNRIMIALDTKGGKLAIKGWKEITNLDPIEFGRLYDDLDVSFLYTNINVEGMQKGINREEVKKAVNSLSSPVYVAGGISSVDDVLFIKEIGAAGVIIGTALYTGKLKFEEIVKLQYEKI